MVELHSDLRAELDQLPKPGQLMFVEPKTTRPFRLVGVPPSAMTPEESQPLPVYLPEPIHPGAVHLSYVFQIQLRLTLNRVHASLYLGNKSGMTLSISTPLLAKNL